MLSDFAVFNSEQIVERNMLAKKLALGNGKSEISFT